MKPLELKPIKTEIKNKTFFTFSTHGLNVLVVNVYGQNRSNVYDKSDNQFYQTIDILKNIGYLQV